MNKKIHIGISGWSYPDWKGIFYPEGIKQRDWLGFYAQSFDTVEINSSFYHLPKAQTVLNWAEKVPTTFKFCPKMSRYLTHTQKLKNHVESLKYFFELFAPIKKMLGPVLLQLPPSLKFEPGVVTHFFKTLRNNYSQYNFALEARHNTWLEKEAVTLLRKYNVAWVISQSGVGFPYSEQITSNNIYFRFHGPDKLYASLYTNKTMREYTLKFRKWLGEGHNIWIYFNNCYHGYAIENANMLRKMLG